MIRFATVAAACVLAISSNSAMAAAASSASITGLSFQLIDLNPNDGIAPSFNFLSQQGSTLLSVSATDNMLGEADSVSRKRAGTFTFSQQFLSDLTNTGGSASVGSTSLSASGHADGPQTSYNASASTGSTPSYYYSSPLNLSLSANSLLLISANVDLAASASNAQPCNSYYYYCTNSEVASASATLNFKYNYNSNGTNASFNDTKSLSLQATAHGSTTYFNGYQSNPNYPWYWEPIYVTVPGVNENKTLHEALTTVFTNSTGFTQSGALGLSVSVSGSAMTAPAVPEPETYGLALAGLAVVGLVARRRRG